LRCYKEELQLTKFPNNRQIRNAFQTAIALAEFRAAEQGQDADSGRKVRIELRREHFETVAETSKAFDKYLLETHGGHDESDLAALEELRRRESSPVAKHRGKVDKHRSEKVKSSKRAKVEIDSEESEDRDSEDSEDDSQDGLSGSGDESDNESVEEEEPVKPVKGKKVSKGRR
jgi:hypothetical protein